MEKGCRLVQHNTAQAKSVLFPYLFNISISYPIQKAIRLAPAGSIPSVPVRMAFCTQRERADMLMNIPAIVKEGGASFHG